jgi:ferrous iron transport protein B
MVKNKNIKEYKEISVALAGNPNSGKTSLFIGVVGRHVNVLDGTNLERNLYLTTQLMELEVNSVIALNMYDEVKEQKIEIDFKQLEKLLGSHIIPTNSIKKEGFTSLLHHIVRVYTGALTVPKNKLSFSGEVEENIETLSSIIKGDQILANKYNPRWLAIKLLENDLLTNSAAKERAIWLS